MNLGIRVSKLEYFINTQRSILRNVEKLDAGRFDSLLLFRQQVLYKIYVDRLEGWKVHSTIDSEETTSRHSYTD